MNTLAEVYRHVGEKVRSDLAKKGISAQRYVLKQKILNEMSSLHKSANIKFD